MSSLRCQITRQPESQVALMSEECWTCRRTQTSWQPCRTSSSATGCASLPLTFTNPVCLIFKRQTLLKANTSMTPSLYQRQGSSRLLGKLLYSGGRLCLPRRPACSARMEICRQPCWKRDHACNQQVSSVIFWGHFSPQGAGDGTEFSTDVNHIRSQSADA